MAQRAEAQHKTVSAETGQRHSLGGKSSEQGKSITGSEHYSVFIWSGSQAKYPGLPPENKQDIGAGPWRGAPGPAPAISLQGTREQKTPFLLHLKSQQPLLLWEAAGPDNATAEKSYSKGTGGNLVLHDW